MNPLFEGKTFYDILEIPSDASPHEIKVAYEKAKNTYSPSSPALYTIFSEEETQELNRILEMAYNVLSHPGRRIEYDKSVSEYLAQRRVDLIGNETNNTDGSKSSLSENSSASGNNGIDYQNEPTKQSAFGRYVLDESFEAKINNASDIDGNFLQKVRHYKNITLDQLSEKSKISKTYILAIESHDFDSLPARVFVRGFVVQIAKLLDLDEQKVANMYMKNYTDPQ